MRPLTAVILATLPWFFACARDAPSTTPPPDDAARMTIRLRSSAFDDGQPIPKQYTCDGMDTSPPLSWSDVPTQTQSLALICDDPDAPRGDWTHWIVYNLPADQKAIAEGVSTEPEVDLESPGQRARQGKNDFGKVGYGGPCPPGGTHHYNFRIYALDATLNVTGTPTKAEILSALKGHILAEGRLIGTYSR